MVLLTAGEECQSAARSVNSFINDKSSASIPPSLIVGSLGVAIVKGAAGVAVVRLKSGEWSAPCAFALHNSSSGEIAKDQETVILFMSERSIISLVSNASVILNQTHSFLPGPLTPNYQLDPSIDMYLYVRYNNGFTPADLIHGFMSGWAIGEDKERHRRWHGDGVSWYDVLTNKISVDRSSVGNALYLVLNLVAGRAGSSSSKNFVDMDKMVGPRPSEVYASSNPGSVRSSVASVSSPLYGGGGGGGGGRQQSFQSPPTSAHPNHQMPFANHHHQNQNYQNQFNNTNNNNNQNNMMMMAAMNNNNNAMMNDQMQQAMLLQQQQQQYQQQLMMQQQQQQPAMYSNHLQQNPQFYQQQQQNPQFNQQQPNTMDAATLYQLNTTRNQQLQQQQHQQQIMNNNNNNNQMMGGNNQQLQQQQFYNNNHQQQHGGY